MSAMSDLVEQAARAYYETGVAHWKTLTYPDWIDVDPQMKEAIRTQARVVAAIVRKETLEEAAKVVTEHYETLSTEHRLLLVNRADAIRKLGEE